ncbi:pentapeptide repeat-containing protein [Streptomyces beihaiensis]|uniref:Pentapeptide repeat-containing protein n=1 Tax=Streptomyces beihaiensis TaxID=2984495 RepID=A0ABT3TVP2_9ACTN|nr:pentapeptide repeat-containing protein [Streptomyces beihaiensis]MCX3061115.1 pentapeptide repeat-containing protein [Streptomyces beihaiensis]
MGRPETLKDNLTARGRYATLQRETFDRADLVSVRLQSLWFTRCTFRETDLRQAALDGCHFKLCDLRGADLSGASMRGVTLAGCDLTGADLRAADLTGARFGRVLTGAAPHGLTDATDVRLDNAILRDLQLDQVIGWPTTG